MNKIGFVIYFIPLSTMPSKYFKNIYSICEKEFILSIIPIKFSYLEVAVPTNYHYWSYQRTADPGLSAPNIYFLCFRTNFEIWITLQKKKENRIQEKMLFPYQLLLFREYISFFDLPVFFLCIALFESS